MKPAVLVSKGTRQVTRRLVAVVATEAQGQDGLVKRGFISDFSGWVVTKRPLLQAIIGAGQQSLASINASGDSQP